VRLRKGAASSHRLRGDARPEAQRQRTTDDASSSLNLKPNQTFADGRHSTAFHKKRGGRRSRDKGNRAERHFASLLRGAGFSNAQRVPLSGSVGGRFAGDVSVALLGVDRCIDVKVRGNGFGRSYKWLEAAGADLLIVRADRREPLVVVPLGGTCFHPCG
jgi:hypothetical protein